MNLKNIGTIKKVCSAVLLSGMVVVSVVATQPQKVEPVLAVANTEPHKSSIPPRTYEAREIASSRADKPYEPVRPTTDFTYTVKQGDTLSGLAATYGVTVDQVMAANGLDSDKLSLDQKLLIPVSGKVKAIKPDNKPVPQSVPKQVAKTAKKAQHPKAVVSRARYNGRTVGQLIKWSEARNIFSIGAVATVIDVNTGYTFKIKRKGGHNHADCEPLTSADTAIMKKIYGSWSWDRRAIVVQINGRKIAASMAGMPHGSSDIAGNGFSGHFDVHFLGSMTHGSEYTKSHVPMVDHDHQAMVKKAAGL